MLRAYVRTSRRTGISMPFWLAIPANLIWVTVMLVAWVGLVIAWVTLTAWRHGEREWRRRHQG